MQDEIATVDDREILIRPMDQAHIISECAHHRTKGRTSEGFARFHAEIMRRYGNAGIVALCEDKIVGYVNFYPAVLNEKFQAPLCPEIDESRLKTACDEMEWPGEPGDTLALSCVNLDRDLVREGIGTKLVQKAMEWARDNQYKKVHTGANDTQWWTPCKEFYEKMGFRVIRTVEFKEPREDGELREYVMEFVLMG